MSILKFIERVCVQTAVYWAPVEPDGYGGMIYADPVEVKVRWDDVTELIRTNDGKEITSAAQVLSNADMEENGFLFLGKMTDIPDEVWIKTAGEELYPSKIPKAFVIIKRMNTPLFASSEKFVKTYYL